MALIQSTAIPSGATDYELEQSLKFEDGRSTYLSKTFASAGNRRTWTWSAWIKRSNSSATHMLFFTAIAGDLTEDDHFGIRLDSGTSSNIVLTWGDGNTAVTNAIFRDPSAWMHIVVAIDTTQGTDTNRVKVYVNGTQQTFSSTDLPSQNFEYGINKAQEHNIASRVVYGASANYYDGYLAEVNFIDGQALTPSDFGETGTYNEWKPIEYSGSYGTNGFYLPFKQDYTVEGFSAVTYKGNGTSQYIGGTGFQPDLTWIKRRDSANSHRLQNSVTGSLNSLSANQTGAELVEYDGDGVLSFNTDGFRVGYNDSNMWNASAGTYVSWNWDMGADTPTGFGAVVYRGNEGTQSVSGYGFKPDLVWFKQRDGTRNHTLIDSLRGGTKQLFSNSTGSEETYTTAITSFDTDGFTIGSQYNINEDNKSMVAWGWDMGNTTVTNTSGSINTQVRANPTYGQSIISYTANGTSGATLGHGLNSAPEFIIAKRRNSTEDWGVGHTSLGWTKFIRLNTTGAEATATSLWNDTAPSSTLVTLGDSGIANNSASTEMIMYAFHSVSGYSKFGSYTGNGSSTGPTVTLGFRPAMIILKPSSSADHWNMYDSTRDPLNPTDSLLFPNRTNAEATGQEIEITDTGFQLKTDNAGSNGNGETYIYMAFAGGMDSISDYNTDGSIDSRVKASTTYGQSVVSYTGNATSGATVGHGLSSTPEMIILKNRDSGTDWNVFHTSRGATKFLRLNSNVAEGTNSAIWNDTAPTNSVFSLGNNADPNSNNEDYIAYCFHSVTGYSKFGSYTGNGSTTGPSVTTGFKVGFLLTKCADSATGWAIVDNTRTPTNPVEGTLYPDKSDAEYTGDQHHIDLNDNGFQIKNNNSRFNTNGDTYIYMAFADKREYAYWLDQSGQNNDWTSNSLTESDISVDSPTNNFATLNPLHKSDRIAPLSEGNLTATYGSGFVGAYSTMLSESGKWYTEVLVTRDAGNFIGVWKEGAEGLANPQDSTLQLTYYRDGRKSNGTTFSSYGASYTVGDVIGIALDQDNNNITFYKNNVSQGQIDLSSMVTGTSPVFIGGAGRNDTQVWNFGQDSSFAGNKTAQGYQDGNDIGDFYYTPPTGFLALCTKNLPDVAVTPSEHFNTVLYTGNGTTGQSITGVGFQSDFSWFKARASTTGSSHRLYDAVRGVTHHLRSNTTGAETTDTELTSFDADGFTIDDDGNGSINDNNIAYVAWNWKANGSGSSNTNGSITSTVSANVDAGFSIVSYTGTGSVATIGHGLSAKPELIITKARSDSQQWGVQNGTLGATKYLLLDTTGAAGTASSLWNDTEPTSSVFTVGTTATTNGSSTTYIAYCFHSVDGYSKVGSYTGNGNADGTFVYTGFKPMYVLTKQSSTTGSWTIHDAKRDIDNPLFNELIANGSDAEHTSDADMDFTSNGFKIRRASGQFNTNGATVIYLAFAETPFKNSNAR